MDLGAEEGTTFVDAAIGRTHSLLVGSNGQVWSAGKNDLGQVSSHSVVLSNTIHILSAVRASCLPGDNKF